MTTSTPTTRRGGLLLALFISLVVGLIVTTWLSTLDADDQPARLDSLSAPDVTGEPLPRFEGSDDAGLLAPVAVGADLFGQDPVALPLADTPTIVVFLAHWCSHCRAEVPVVQDWVDDGGLPTDVAMVSVATAIDANRPNYPPDAWLEREGWTAPTMVDDGSVAASYGLTSYPFWAFVRADGTVTRTTGELTPAELDAAVAWVTGTD